MNTNDGQKNGSDKSPSLDKGTLKVKLKLKFKDALPKEGVDLLGIAKKLAAKKFGK